MKKLFYTSLFIITLISLKIKAQYQPKNTSEVNFKNAKEWVDKTYKNISQEEKLRQQPIISIYTNKGKDYIKQVRNILTNDKIGNLTLIQNDFTKEINLINKLQQKLKVPMMVGIESASQLYQRITTSNKSLWTIY